MPGIGQGPNFAPTEKDRALSLAQMDGQTLPVLPRLTPPATVVSQALLLPSTYRQRNQRLRALNSFDQNQMK